MEEKAIKKLEFILEEHYKHTQTVSEEILEELKNISKNYGDLKRNLEMFKKSTFFKCGAIQKYESLFIEVEKMLEKEMNDLPLTNRS